MIKDTLQRSGKKDEDDPKPTSSDVSGDLNIYTHIQKINSCINGVYNVLLCRGFCTLYCQNPPYMMNL